MKINLVILLSLIAIISIGRFLYLEKSPPGFYVDESIGASNIICMRQTGRDGYGVSFPLFADAARNAGGYTTPTFLYSGVIWTAIFGDSIWSFRAFSAFLTTLTILGIFLLVKLKVGQDAALWSVLAASLSPWAWQFSRISWDPPLMPMFVIWGVYFFLKSNRIGHAVIAGLLLAFAMYSYPPGRVLVPVLAFGLVGYKYFLKDLNLKFTLTLALTIVLTSIPLGLFLLSPEAMARFGTVGIANVNYLRQFDGPHVLTFFKILFKNLFLHFDPKYLFVTGDSNLRHSTQFAGQWSWLDMYGVCALFLFLNFRSNKSLLFLGFCFFAFIAGILPAALTWESIPHALRSIGAWPFLSCLAGLGLAQLHSKSKNVEYITLAIASLFLISFGGKYFKAYPMTGYAWFDSDVKVWAEDAQKSGDWTTFERQTSNYLELGRHYFQMVYGKKSCGQFNRSE